MFVGDPEKRAEELTEEIEGNPSIVEDEFYDLRTLLSHKDGSVRSTAYSAFLTGFKDNPPKYVSLVERLLTSEEGYHRHYGARALARTSAISEHPEALSDTVPKLIDLFDETEPTSKRRIFGSFKYVELGNRGFAIAAIETFAENLPSVVQPYVSDVLSLIDADHSSVRMEAASTLYWLARDSPAAIREYDSELANVISHDHDYVREYSLKTLTTVGTEYPDVLRAHRDQLIARLDDQESGVRRAALTALDKLADVYPDDVRPATSRIAERMDGGRLEQQKAASLLATIHEAHPDAIDPRSVLPPSSPWPAEADDRERAATAYAAVAGRWGSRPEEFTRAVAESAEEIATLLDDEDDDVRKRATEALYNASRATPEEFTTIVPTLIRHAKSNENAWKIVTAISNVADAAPDAVAPYLEDLYDLATRGDGDTQALKAIKRVIELRGKPEASVPAARECLFSDDAAVRAEAGRVIGVAAREDATVKPLVLSLCQELDGQAEERREVAADALGAIAEEHPPAVDEHFGRLTATLDVGENAEAVASVLGPLIEADSERAADVVSQIEPQIGEGIEAVSALQTISNSAPTACVEVVDTVAGLLTTRSEAYTNPAAGILANVAKKRPAVVAEVAPHVIEFLEREMDGFSSAVTTLAAIAVRRPDAVAPAVPQLTRAVRGDINEVYFRNRDLARALYHVANAEPDAVVPSVYDLYDLLETGDDSIFREWVARTLAHIESANPGVLERVQNDIDEQLEGSTRDRRYAVETMAAIAAVAPSCVSHQRAAAVSLMADDVRSIRFHAARSAVYLYASTVLGDNRFEDEVLSTETQARAIDILTAGLGETNFERWVGAEALGVLGELGVDSPKNTILMLSENVDYPEHFVRAAVAEALGQFEDKGSVSSLADLQHDEYAYVAETASAAIDRIEGSLRYPSDRDVSEEETVVTSSDEGQLVGMAQRKEPDASHDSRDTRPAGSVGTTSRAPDFRTVTSPPRHSLTYDDIEIGDLIGSGGQGIVYEAHIAGDEPPSRIALKEPQGNGRTLEEGVVAAFLDEAETWRMLDDRERTKPRWRVYEHIVGVIDTGDQLPWIAMEYMDGGSLRDRLDDHPDGLPIDEALWIGECLCKGVELAHNYGVAHLDLKPGNILFRQTADGEWDVPKLADWGVSRQLAEQTGTVAALSVEYAAPEQFEPPEFGDPDMLTDVYQVGVLLYTILTGEPPYTGSRLAVMREIIDGDGPAPPSEKRPELDGDLDRIIQSAMAREKSERHRTIGLLANEIQLFRERQVNDLS